MEVGEGENPVFAFLVEGDSSQLWQCLKNYEAIGHIELCRVTIRQLSNERMNSENGEKLRAFLVNALTVGLPEQSITIQDRTQVYMLWMYLQELQMQENENIDSGPLLIVSDRLLFDLLIIQSLDSLEITPSLSDFFQVLRIYHFSLLTLQHPESISESLRQPEINIRDFDTDTIIQLRELSHKVPEIAREICRKLIFSDLDSYTGTVNYETLCNNQYKILHMILNMMEESVEVGNEEISTFFSFFSIFPVLSSIPHEMIQKIKKIFEESHKALSASKTNTRSSDSLGTKVSQTLRDQVVQSLLSTKNKEILALYSQIEDQYLSDIEKTAEAIFGSLAVPLDFWAKYYQFVRVNDEHIFEYILKRSTTQIQQGDITEATQTLKHFQTLKPLVLLASWSKHSTDTKLLNKIFTQLYTAPQKYTTSNGVAKLANSNLPMIDQHITDACCLLRHQIEITKWCAKKLLQSNAMYPVEENFFLLGLENDLKDSKSQQVIHTVAGKMLLELREHSMLYLLQKSFRGSEIIVEDFSHLLHTEDSDSNTTCYYKRKNFLEISSFCCLTAIDDLFLQWKNCDSTLSEDLSVRLKSIQRIFFNIPHVELQTKILDYVIGFVFLPKEKMQLIQHHCSTDIDRAMINGIMGFVKECLEQIETENSNSNAETQNFDEKHFKILFEVINEGFWRLQLLDDVFDSESSNNCGSLWEVWSSSAESVLMNCLRSRFFISCEDIIAFYQLECPLVDVTKLSKQVETVRASLLELPEDFDASKTVLGQLDPSKPSELLSWIDILTSTPTSMGTTQYLLEEIKKGIPQTFTELSVQETLLKLLESLQLTHKYYRGHTLYDIIQSSSLGCDGERTETQNSLWLSPIDYEHQKCIGELFEIFCTLDTSEIVLTPQQITQYRETLKWSRENFATTENCYFLEFLTLIDQMLVILYPNIDGTETSDSCSLEFLRKSPDELIGRFIYENEDFTKAEQLAKLFNRDLMMGVVNSIQRVQQGNQESCENENNDDSPNVMLTGHIVDYFTSHCPLIGVFACLYKNPISTFPGKFLNESQRILNSIDSQHSVITRWLYSQLLQYKDFSQAYLNTTYDDHQYLHELRDEKPPRIQFDDNLSETLFSDTEQQVFNLLLTNHATVNLSNQTKFYESLVKQFMNKKDFTNAWRITETFLEGGGSLGDALLQEFIQNDPPNSWKFLSRLNDKKLACSITFANMKHWNIQICLDILNMLLEHAKNDSSLPQQQIQGIKDELVIYEEILNLSDSSWYERNDGWQSVATACRRKAEEVVTTLTKQRQFDLARKVSLLFAPDEAVRRTIEREFIVVQMRSMPPESFPTLTRGLEKRKDSLAIAEHIINSYENTIPHLDTKKPTKSDMEQFQSDIEYFIEIQLFLVRFIISHCSDDRYLEQYTIDLLLNKQMGLKVLRIVSIEHVERFLHLSSFPALIIEGLILSEQTLEVSQIFQQFPNLRDDSMIIFYAEKAMSLISRGQSADGPDGPDSSYKPSSAHSSLRQIRRDFIAVRHSEDTCRRLKKMIVIDDYAQQLRERKIAFSGDSISDQQIREAFCYPKCPNIRLFKALTSLCTDYRQAAEKCLELANQLSIATLTSQDPLFLTDQIQQVLLTAKFLLLEAELSSEICDRLLDHLGLIQALIIRQCENSFTLLDFSNQNKMEQLRDRLIKDDHLQLALDVCLKCHLEPSSVWASWGLSLLRMGNYTKAKEKFANCLKSNQESQNSILSPVVTRSRPSSAQNRQLNQSRLINDIVRILEKKPMKDSKTLRQEQREIVRKRLMNIQSKPKASSNTRTTRVKRVQLNQLDTERYMQCIYYLTRFGSDDDILSFWMRHANYEDAVRFILQKRLSSKIFIEVAMKIIHARGNEFLQTILSRVDPMLETCQEYLLRFCAMLSSVNAEEILLDTQIFMGDNTRAGLTCVSKAKRARENIPLQMKYLDVSMKCFTEAIEKQQCRESGAPLNEHEVSELLRSVKLQINILKQLTTSFHGKIPSEIAALSVLAGNPAAISTLAETLIAVGHFSVAYPVLQEFDSIVDKQEVYYNACVKISRAKRYTTLSEVIRSLRPTGSTEDEINEIVSACAVIFLKQGDTKSSEKLIAKITSFEMKVGACIQCGKLERAFLDSAQANRPDLVQRVQDAAQKRGARNVNKMCVKFFRDKQKRQQ